MRRDNVLTILGFFLLAVMFVGFPVPPAWAGGLWMYQRATPEVGTANARVAACSEDASIAASNPAGMTRLEKPELRTTGSAATTCRRAPS